MGLVLTEQLYLKDFSFWKRSIVLEVLRKASQLTIDVTSVGKYTSLTHEGYLCHVVNRDIGIVGAITTDEKYPSRVAFDVLNHFINLFYQEYGSRTVNELFMHNYISTIQNPADVDKLVKIKKDIEATRVIVLETIEQLIDRGEKLDNLEDRSIILLKEARTFKTKSEDLNSCCTIL